MSATYSNRSFSVYSVPPQLLETLAVRSIQAQNSDQQQSTLPTSASTLAAAAPPPAGTGISCQTCPQAEFDTIEEQRAHFKSDWHRYNVKVKLNASGKAISLEEWDNMVEGIPSISGSASSTSGSETSKVARLLKNQTLDESDDGSSAAAELADRQRRAHLRTAVIWFSPSAPVPELNIPKDTQFGVHRALFPPYEKAGDYLDELRRMQLTGDEEEDGERRLTFLMVAGGHFAGMVVGIRPRGKTEKQDVKGAGDVRVLKHKTFHRYTTRKKQGGSQAINDNNKSKAISAGAMLRRYGEQALQEEIRALLIDWADDIHASERIFIRASTHGKKSFWGYEDAPLEKNDERIRTFPFPTRRPTLQELLRCWHELTRVRVSHLSEEALKQQDEAYIASLQPKTQTKVKPAPAPVKEVKPLAPKISAEEEARLDRWKRLDEMVRKGRINALKPFWEKYSEEFLFSPPALSSLSPEEQSQYTQPYLLSAASSSSQPEVLTYFLSELKFNPTLAVPGDVLKRPYDLASSKVIRDIYRKVAYDNPDLWDWKAARVPPGLSEEMEAEQREKKAGRRKGLKEKLKEREKARQEAEAREAQEEEEKRLETEKREREKPTRLGVSGPQKLGGGSAEGLAGLSAEMRMQIERERRARAAEARFGSR
ncbi:cytoplasmic protein [Cryptococcus neoformans]|uniref:Cytoplasmic protein n=1 Tax=Cryptococcus neoformans Tu259-1 TaxID=1230072 RepID=A0A854QC59_CRYNE|nr:cytoplasmic protein [Cryptococcus neoformans var. grubii AD1-83a]OXG12976.1 cytoplasmic protein [Cryptococcus neoformans var. grubii Tu259-1]OXG46027.1 cytoplasmic protein [Cryptococcus neoformans var. grubii Th84]OXG50460.1 cytoplasmic protein [Cryptococcus neoformans var. grubii MW-RSA1955]OXG53894.1 cytoplasmic protein [Cryptococcus neoformans var. grubii CHC193]OXG58673.1 cytoplasmic protein [Cryptococcus neoformans var. grubii c8]OXG79324.1 cytoplasmic protein [Cryptococcus neoformans